MNFLDKVGLTHFWSKIKEYIANKKYISSSNGSIKNIVELTYEEYQALTEIDPNTEYHIKENRDSGDSIQSLIEQLIQENRNREHPVGSLEFNVSGTNPSVYLGVGTWSLWGAGKVPVGVDENDSLFYRVEKTGGEAYHTLTLDEMPVHNHYIHNTNPSGVDTGGNTIQISGNRYGWNANMKTQDAGGDQPHNNLQPYITCYMWKRVS